VLQQQAFTLWSLLLQRSKPELEKLRSLLRCSSKQAPEPEILRSLLCCNSKQAPEPEILRSLLHCNSKQTPELLKKLWSFLRCSSKQASSGVGDPPELVALQQQASSGARSLLAEQQAPEVSGARSFLRMFR